MTAGTAGPHSTWSSPLAAALQRFLDGKRAAGYRYRAEAQALGALDLFPQQGPLAGRPRDHQRHRACLRGPARGRVGDHACASADAYPGGVVASSHSMTRGRLCRRHDSSASTAAPTCRVSSRLMKAAGFSTPATPWTGAAARPGRDLVLRTLLVLLYLTGLRAGEALRLTLAGRRSGDGSAPHLRHQVRQVTARAPRRRRRSSTRAVSGTLSRTSSASGHRASRSSQRPPASRTRSRPCVTSSTRSLAAAGIPRWQGGRSLRLHDLRHSFAVLRLTLWYRQQAPLGNLLPALATYLGHVDIASSQRYLQLTEDIVADFTHRYATRFGHLLTDGGPR